MPVRAWKARNCVTKALRGSGAPKPRASGLQSLPEARDSAPRPLLSPTARDRPPLGWWVVEDRRCYSDGGLGVSPRRFPVALKALPEPWRLGGVEARFRRLSARKPSNGNLMLMYAYVSIKLPQ